MSNRKVLNGGKKDTEERRRSSVTFEETSPPPPDSADNVSMSSGSSRSSSSTRTSLSSLNDMKEEEEEASTGFNLDGNSVSRPSRSPPKAKDDGDEDCDDEKEDRKPSGENLGEHDPELAKKIVHGMWSKAWGACLERFYHQTASVKLSLELRDAFLRVTEVEWMDTKARLNEKARAIFEPDKPPYPLAFDTWARGALEIMPQNRRESVIDPFLKDETRGGQGDDGEDEDDDGSGPPPIDKKKGFLGKMQMVRSHSRGHSGQGSRGRSQHRPKSSDGKRKENNATGNTGASGPSKKIPVSVQNVKLHEQDLLPSQFQTDQLPPPPMIDEDGQIIPEVPKTAEASVPTRNEQEIINRLEEKSSRFPFLLDKPPPMVPADKQEPLFERKHSFFHTILPVKSQSLPSPHISEHYLALGLKFWNPADYPGKKGSGVYKNYGQSSKEALIEHRERHGLDVHGHQLKNPLDESSEEEDSVSEFFKRGRIGDAEDKQEVVDEGEEDSDELDQGAGKIVLRSKQASSVEMIGGGEGVE